MYSAKLISQALHALSQHTHNNPQYLALLPQYPCITLTSPSVSGGKFWQGTATESGVIVQWGRIGKPATTKIIPLIKCAHRDPAEELTIRCLKKLRGGYDISPHETYLP